MVDKTQRRLAAILAADVAGYTRLVELDTDGTVAAWMAARDEVITPLVEGKSGRIIKFTGDGFLVEFPSVQDAVTCAIAMQDQLVSNLLKFRMGINVGDIVDDGGDVHGEGVNIAARLETLADPGGICVSGDVYNQVHNRIEAAFEDMGEQEVKHVSKPVRVYAIKSNSAQEVKTKPLQHAEKPSIAILPFDNMSNDSEQEYFCDGVVEDIITEISKFRWLSVIARHSSFSYKGTSTNIKTVGLELGARYVVEGSIRKAGNRIRINAQLIDSTDDSHVWAEKYDRELTDIFELQDEIAQTLVATIEPELSASELRRARRKPTGNLDAWELVHRAFSHIYQYKSEDFEAAEQLLNDAIALDPEFASAHAVKGYSIYVRTIMGFAKYPKESIELASSCVTKAIALDDRDAFAFRALGTIQYLQYDYEESLKNLDYAIKLNPNFAQAYISKALAMMLAGDKDSEETRVTARTGMRLSPKDPMTWQAMNVIGGTHLFDGELDEAAEILKTACSLPVTNYYPFLYLAITLELMGQDGEAKSAMASAKILGPSLTIAKHNRQMGRPVVSRLEAIGAIQAMRELGLPDG